MIPDTKTARLLQILARVQAITTPALAAQLGEGLTPSHANTLCRHLERRGWLVRLPASTVRRSVWGPSAKLLAEGVEAALMRNVRDQVRDLVEDGVQTFPELARRTGSSHSTIYSIVKRLERHGVLRRVYHPNRRTTVEPWPDELDPP